MGQDVLELKDIRLPDSIGWWPPAVGWWILAVLIPLLCYLIILLYKHITRKTALKTARQQLQNIKLDKTLDNKATLIALSTLLRRVAISISPREQVASLTGRAWLDYLDSTALDSPFTQSVGALFANAPYQQGVPTDAEMIQVIKICENWLKAQKVGKK